jgi:glycosyltransferase involved in cell wall biosynthesis
VNVLHVIQRYPPAVGGAEAWCRGLARRQAARGDVVTVLACRAVTDDDLWSDPPHPPGACAVGAADLDDGVLVIRCEVEPPLGPAGRRVLPWLGVPMLARAHSPELYGRLFHRVRTADVVHAHAVPGPHVFAAALAARAARRPFVLTPFLHAGDPEHESPAVGRILRAADLVVALTTAEADAIAARGIDRTRIALSTNALDDADAAATPPADVRAALRIPPDQPLVLFVGRKSPSKGIELLIDACARSRRAPVLVLVGPTTAWFRSALAARRSANVLDVPALPEAAKASLIAASDVLVLPSKHESFGGVFLEAWRVGTPVIGADIPSVREVVGDAGFLFRPDDAADLAARLDQALGNRAAARAAAERGRARLATAFTWSRVVAPVDDAYARAIAARRGDRSASIARLSWH